MRVRIRLPRRRQDPRAVDIDITATALGEPTTGLWCEPCALPSRVEMPVATTLDGHPWALIIYRVCLDCGREDVT